MNIPFTESYAFFLLLGFTAGVIVGMFLHHWLISAFDGNQ